MRSVLGHWARPVFLTIGISRKHKESKMRLFAIGYGMGYLACLAYLGKEACHLEKNERLPYLGCMAVLSVFWPAIGVWMLYETIAMWMHVRKSKRGAGGDNEY